MDIRASYRLASVSRTFIIAALVVVAMGLAATSGYVARGLTNGGAAAAPAQSVHAAPGTVLRQDYPVRGTVELPGYIQSEITPQPTLRLLQDDPNFIAKYAAASPTASR